MTEDERDVLAKIELNVAELVKWKDAVNDLLYGTIKGEFGYFHRINFIWRLLILWPVMILSIAFGALLTFIIQHLISGK